MSKLLSQPQKKLGVLFRCKQYLNSAQLFKLYTGFIRPCLEYCSHIWDRNRIGICFSGLRPSDGTSKVMQRRRREKRSKTEQEKKHPTKLVKAATWCLLSPHTTNNGLDIEGVSYLGFFLLYFSSQQS